MLSYYIMISISMRMKCGAVINAFVCYVLLLLLLLLLMLLSSLLLLLFCIYTCFSMLNICGVSSIILVVDDSLSLLSRSYPKFHLVCRLFHNHTSSIHISNYISTVCSKKTTTYYESSLVE